MLIDRETESRLERVIQGLVSSYSMYAIGRQLGQTIPEAVGTAVGTKRSPLTFLEVSYLAGKAARELGPNRLKRMSERQLIAYLRQSNVELSNADRVTLRQLKDSTERWLGNRTNAWSSKLKSSLDVANREWRAALAQTAFTDALAMSTARNAVLVALVSRLNDDAAGWDGDVDRVLQTEMNTYFQHGQVSGVDGDELVYKIPRATACRHCLRIHLNDDGSPRMYRLGDVLGNSNVGLPAPMWNFTIGPVHPHCYCILYYSSDTPPRRSPELQKSLRAALASPRTNTCGVADDATILFEDQTPGDHEHGMQDHDRALIEAARKVFGK